MTLEVRQISPMKMKASLSEIEEEKGSFDQYDEELLMTLRRNSDRADSKQFKRKKPFAADDYDQRFRYLLM